MNAVHNLPTQLVQRAKWGIRGFTKVHTIYSIVYYSTKSLKTNHYFWLFKAVNHSSITINYQKLLFRVKIFVKGIPDRGECIIVHAMC